MTSHHTGTCTCGDIKIEIEGDPAFVALCHCLNCQKTTSSTYSTNWPMPRSSVKLVSGSPTSYECLGGSGSPVKRVFCARCSCVMWTESDMFAEYVVVKAGIVDDRGIAKFKPTSESFVTRKPEWVDCVEGTTRFDTVPPQVAAALQAKKP